VLSDVTIAGNDATSCGGGIENGGALTLFNLTVGGNTAPTGKGGGLANGAASSGCFFSGGTARVNNTIFANNSTENCHGTMASLGHNLATDGSCGFGAAGDLVTAAPGLEPVLDSDGHVWLYRLLTGSPALDAGSGPYDAATDVGCSPVDQVGTSRPKDGNGDGQAVCDIGTYERDAPQALSCDGQTATVVGTAGDDELDGTDGADVIVGLGGEDELEGGRGDDRICGGDGDDELEGGRGSDQLFGEAGEDELDGGSGVDRADGGSDDDECRAETEVNCED
jgi:Ca2+-binding RTX toxin-like protein